jgi:hypothetical protein
VDVETIGSTMVSGQIEPLNTEQRCLCPVPWIKFLEATDRQLIPHLATNSLIKRLYEGGCQEVYGSCSSRSDHNEGGSM